MTSNYLPENFVRYLGYVETLMTLMHRSYSGTTQGSEMISLDRIIATNKIEKSAEFIFSKFQLLRCSISEHDNKLYFRENIDFCDISVRQINALSDAQLWTSYQQEVDTPIDSNNGMWRVLIINDQHRSHIILTCHHAAIDAASFFTLINSMLEIAGQSTEQYPLLCDYEPASCAVDDLLPVRQGTPPFNKFTPLAYQKNAAISDRNTGAINLVLPGNYIDDINKFCKGTSMSENSLLTSVFLKALLNAKLINPITGFRTAVSNRDKPLERLNGLGCYISVADNVIDVSQPLVQVMKQYQAELYRRILSDCRSRPLWTLPTLQHEIDKLSGLNAFIHGAGVTNIGEVKIKTNFDAFNVIDFDAIANRLVGTASCVMHIIKFNNQLKLTFVYTQPLISNSSAALLTNEYMKMLDHLLNSGIDGLPQPPSL